MDPENKDVVSEREAFLLRELQKMMIEERLIGSTKEVVVVPARHAWPEYERFHAYVCQPKRTFQAVKHIAFYSSGQIHPLVPTILETHESILLERGLHKGKLGVMVDGLIDAIPFSGKHVGQRYKVMLLSPPDDPNTLRLDAPIMNDLLSKGGRTTAFTQNQRYVSLQRLKAARVTSDLVTDDHGK